MSVSRPTVERKIYFNRIDVGQEPSGKPRRFDPVPILQHLERLPFASGGRYWETTDGKVTCCWVPSGDPRCRLSLGIVRRGGLPQVERAGALSPLPIPQDSGLAEQTYILFLPGNIVGWVFNFYGPRLARLKNYLEAVMGDACPDLIFQPLLQRDVTDRLNRLRHLSLVTLKIRAGFAEQMRQANEDLGTGFRVLKGLLSTDDEEIEITLKRRGHSRGWLDDGFLPIVKRILRLPGVQDEAQRFVVEGLDPETQHVETLDLLSSLLVSRKQIILEDRRTRALDEASAYRAIAEAYRELQEEIQAAAGVLP